MDRCSEEYFSHWSKLCENEPGLWIVRDVKSGQVFRNNTWLQMCNSKHPIGTLSETRAFVVREDVAALEDSHSLALKTGKVVTFSGRMKPDLINAIPFYFAARSLSCDKCKSKCTIILSYAEPALALQPA